MTVNDSLSFCDWRYELYLIWSENVDECKFLGCMQVITASKQSPRDQILLSGYMQGLCIQQLLYPPLQQGDYWLPCQAWTAARYSLCSLSFDYCFETQEDSILTRCKDYIKGTSTPSQYSYFCTWYALCKMFMRLIQSKLRAKALGPSALKRSISIEWQSYVRSLCGEMLIHVDPTDCWVCLIDIVIGMAALR